MTFNWRELEVIEGWLDKEEAQLLHDLAEQMPPGTFWCEIGSWKGKSTVAMAQSGRHGYAIDWFQGSSEHEEETDTLDDYLKNIAPYRKQIETVVGKSQDLYRRINKPIGLLFIDGEHTLEAVERDFMLYYDKVIPGGFIVFHDYASDRWGNPYPGVTVFVDSLIEEGYVVHSQVERCLVLKAQGRKP